MIAQGVNFGEEKPRGAKKRGLGLAQLSTGSPSVHILLYLFSDVKGDAGVFDEYHAAKSVVS